MGLAYVYIEIDRIKKGPTKRSPIYPTYITYTEHVRQSISIQGGPSAYLSVLENTHPTHFPFVTPLPRYV